MNFRNKKLGLTLLLIFAVGVVTPHLVHAGFIDRSLADVVTFSAKFFAYIFNFIFSLLFSLAAALVSFTLKLNATVTDSNLVTVGWIITRDIANLGFVLAMVIIAFATIIGNEEYGYKKLLVKLITAAILVNFSLTIAGVFINFSDVITNFFLAKVSDSPMGLTEKLADAFGAQRFLLGDSNDPLPPNPTDEAGTVTKLSTAAITSLASIAFTTAFTAVATIVLLTVAILLLRRFITLSFLIILAPITWLFWVIPGQGGQFSKWWNNFTKQVFFAPAMMFFVYLALTAATKLGATNETATFFKGGALQALMVTGSQMIVLVGLLIGGLIAAENMGIEGAKVGMKMVNGAWSGAKEYASSNARFLGQKIAQTGAGATATKRLQTLGGSARKLGLTKTAGRLERAGTAIEKEAAAPKRERAGLMSSLGGNIGRGVGVFGKKEEVKLEDRSKGELHSQLSELKERKKTMEASGFAPEAMRALDDTIKKTEGALDKKYDVGSLEGGKKRGFDAWSKNIAGLNAERADIAARGGDTSYHDKTILGATKKQHEELDDTTLEDKINKMAKFEALRESQLSQMKAKIDAEQSEEEKNKLQRNLEKELSYYEKEIGKIENSIKPNNEEEFEAQSARLHAQRSTKLKYMGLSADGKPRADVSSIDAQLDSVQRDMDKLYENRAERPIQVALRDHTRKLQNEIDVALATGKEVDKELQQQLADVKEQAKRWRGLGAKKPKSHGEWQKRLDDLRAAQTELAAKNIKVAEQDITALIDQATEEVKKGAPKVAEGPKIPFAGGGTGGI